jgi:sugar lactone lactonase YvrE
MVNTGRSSWKTTIDIYNNKDLLISSLRFVGNNLVRPECVIATQAGYQYVSDFKGGVSQIDQHGKCTFYGGASVKHAQDGTGILKPNGICMNPDGSFLIAHLGEKDGGIYRISRDNNDKNQISPWLIELNGRPLPPSNFIYLDHQGRYWITISTRHTPRAIAYRSDIKDGFIILVDDNGPRIVADNIGYTNEVYVTPCGKKLYVNATFSRETLSFDIDNKNNLINRRVVARYGAGIYPDGLTMDNQGYLWITSIISNSIVRVNPDTGKTTLMLQDADQSHLAWVEKAYLAHKMGREHLDNVQSSLLQNISSLAFAGKDLSCIYLGCLLGDSIAKISTNFSGLAPSHWLFDSPHLTVKP